MYYEQETPSQRISIKTIASNGICNFVCRMCEIEDDCIMHNHQREVETDQKNFRMKTAREYLKRVKK